MNQKDFKGCQIKVRQGEVLHVQAVEHLQAPVDDIENCTLSQTQKD